MTYVNDVTIEPGTAIALTIEIRGRAGDCTYMFPGDFENSWEIVEGPSKSYEMNASLHTYIVRPTKTGNLQVGEFVLTTDRGQKFNSESFVVQVKNNPPANPDKLFALITLDRNEVYEGEQVLAMYDIYDSYKDISFTAIDINSPNGFLADEIENRRDPLRYYGSEVIGGLRYNVYNFKREILMPVQTGEIEIPSFVMEGHIDNQRRGGQLLAYGPKVTHRSGTAKLTVKPTPPNPPIGFEGAVGQYNMQLKMSRTRLKAHESATLTITLSGTGNLNVLAPPTINFPESFEIYDPKVKRNVRIVESRSQGTVTFEYLIVPREAGNMAVDAYSFSYFDPQAEQYKTLSSAPFNFEIGEGEATANNQVVTSNSEDIKVLASDIKHIKQDGNLNERDNQFFATIGNITGMTLPLLCFFVVFFFRDRFHVEQDEVELKSKQASKVAAKHLQEAKVALDANDSSFYDAVSKATYGYIGYKLNLPATELSKENISQLLADREVASADIATLKELLENCEMARFTPIGDLSKGDIYNSAESIINKLEATLS